MVAVVAKTDWNHWGPAWADAPYMTQPNKVAALLRDSLGLSTQEIAVVQVLVSFRVWGSADYVVWASLDTIADRAGMSKDAAGRAIRGLMARGVVVDAEGRKPCRGHARRYSLEALLARLAELRPKEEP